jgi:hypothetical protein
MLEKFPLPSVHRFPIYYPSTQFFQNHISDPFGIMIHLFSAKNSDKDPMLMTTTTKSIDAVTMHSASANHIFINTSISIKKGLVFLCLPM